MLDIQTYGISVTTLEQVFLEIGHDPNPKPKVPLSSSASAEKFRQEHGDEHLNTPSVHDDKETPDLGKGLNMKLHEKVFPDNATPNLDNRLVDGTGKAGSFLPPIGSA